jgi:hypothetical protein
MLFNYLSTGMRRIILPNNIAFFIQLDLVWPAILPDNGKRGYPGR